MRIGDEDNYLLLADTAPEDPHAPFRLEAKTTASRAQFFGYNDAVFFSLGSEVEARFAAFEELRSHTMDFELTEGCGLHLKRDRRGAIAVVYTIRHHRFGSEFGVSGVIQIEGEHTQAFLREFRRQVFSKA